MIITMCTCNSIWINENVPFVKFCKSITYLKWHYDVYSLPLTKSQVPGIVTVMCSISVESRGTGKEGCGMCAAGCQITSP